MAKPRRPAADTFQYFFNLWWPGWAIVLLCALLMRSVPAALAVGALAAAGAYFYLGFFVPRFPAGFFARYAPLLLPLAGFCVWGGLAWLHNGLRVVGGASPGELVFSLTLYRLYPLVAALRLPAYAAGLKKRGAPAAGGRATGALVAALLLAGVVFIQLATGKQ